MNGAVTGVRYMDEIFHPIVRPYAGAIGQDFVLMDDNARPHRARVVDQYLHQEGIERMEWPAKSPDLNPMNIAGTCCSAGYPLVLGNLGQSRSCKTCLFRNGTGFQWRT